MPELYYHDGTAPRKAKELHYHDGTAVRLVKEAWYHDGTAPRLVYSGAGVVIPLPTIAASAAATGGLAVTSSISWGADGSIVASGVGGSPAWYAPTTAGVGAGFWLRVTKTSGDTPSGITLGTWLPLSSARTATLATSAGLANAKSCALAWDIASDSAGSTIVASATASIYAETAV